ncbi:SNF-related serine/threonine-protein kinase isoform X2 [Periplaneta americana]|uniref:SNF-related serine/threonine-protein kinase isoform X2 n=1 Tax=Periplaneta americana TaxID=6978 RepID=UPI0037E90DE0
MHRTSGRNSYDGKIAGLYDLEETLGRGHFAVVKLARHVFTGEKVAVKVIDKSKLDEISRAHLFQEVRCMKLVQHPNVVRLYEVIDTQTKLYLILELGDGGDLYDYIMRHDGGLGEEVAREYFRQIVRAISYCHRLHVVHRDLKPENVVFFERLGMVKLTDFGFSNRFNPGQKLETSCGSLAYSAPEILLGDSYDAPAVDVWSLGVILYMLVCGQAPFQEANDSETLTMIMDCKYTIPVHVSDACKRLIARMLIREPERRASLEEIAADPWLGEDLNTQPTDFLPLVSREHVSEEDHALIIQKMVNGNIATKEEILDALDKNEYNHITATYFLLAERKLRLHRQEQAQAQQRLRLGQCLPELSPLTPGKPYAKSDNNQEQNCPAPVNQSLLSVRTPGDVPQNYRARKCSIVQEEEDEDDMSSCSGREELTAPHNSLNRRGSRSEGKLNLALQERLAESERRKEKAAAGTAGQKPQNQTATGSPGIHRVAARDDTSSPTAPSWAPPAKKTSPGNSLDIRPKSAVESGSKVNVPAAYIPGSNKWKVAPKQCLSQTAHAPISKPPSLPSVRVSAVSNTSSTTSIITESSTISIPVHMPSSPGTSLLPKYKTMPSPTRPMHSVLSSPQIALNEIFEEGDGENVGSRPNTRGFVARQQSQSRTGGYDQRRSKFHKTRTASCSSSDASDDDSESRKKRAHKLGGDGKSLSQRRDSHDDSSDSQDPGGSGGTGGGGIGGGGTPAGGRECGGRPPAGAGAGVADGSRTSGGNSSSGSGGKRQCSEAAQQPPLSRRHRTGRRRAGETRLRESQSLNRITEVQEAEHSSVTCHSHTSTIMIATTTRSTSSSSSSPKVRGFGARLLQSWSLASSTTKKATVTEEKSSGHQSPEKRECGNAKAETELLTNEQDSSNCVVQSGIVTTGPHVSPAACNTISKSVESNCCAEEKENFCRSSMTKKTSSMTDKQKSGGSKKGRLLGRYFQVHKKLCLPLPGLFNRGRLYKAQSCGSIVRDRVAPPSPASLLLCSDDRWCPITSGSGTKMAGSDDNRHMGENEP